MNKVLVMPQIKPRWLLFGVQDFQSVAHMPALVGFGAALQYTIMPSMGLTVSRLAGLPDPFAVGCALNQASTAPHMRELQSPVHTSLSRDTRSIDDRMIT